MTRRHVLALLVLQTLSCAALAGGLERSVKGQWLGAWVVITSEAYSDCGGFYTNNRVNGNLVKSGGTWRFQPGELAKLDGLDVKRSRLDVLLTLAEPKLVPYQEGPFTLYREASCRVELEVELPRATVKSKDDRAVERQFDRVVERHATEAEALASAGWNEREMEPYPPDYPRTLARHAVWKAEQYNAAIQAKIDHAVAETSRLADRLHGDSNYLSAFAEGVEAARTADLRGCPALLALDLGEIRRQAAQAKSEADLDAEGVQGFEDGKVLVLGLEMIRGLAVCFVPVPVLDLEDTETAAASERSHRTDRPGAAGR